MSEGANEEYALGRFFGKANQEIISHVPHCGYLGMEVIEIGPRTVTLKIPYRNEIIGDPSRGVVFGGVITTLLDHASGISVGCSLPILRSVATLDLRLDYLRAAKPGKDLIGRAECFKTTRSVAFVRGIAYEDDISDPFATSIGSFMLDANREQNSLAMKVGPDRAGEKSEHGAD